MKDQRRATRLIGRHAEWDILWNEFRAAAGGRTRVAFVFGEPGIGKTHLLNAFAAAREDEGAYVLHGGASEAEGMPPYLSFIEALGRHIRSSSGRELFAQTGHTAPILATLFPEMALKIDDVPLSYELPLDQARLRLFEAVGSFIANIASDRPIILMLDDLQWADSASLDLLCAVVRYQPEIRLLILGAVRSGEIDVNDSLNRAIRELNRQRTFRSIDLMPISSAETAALAAELLGAQLNSDGVNVLFAQSEGNPFFAEELLRGWIDSHALQESNDGNSYLLDTNLTATTPASVLGAVRERLNHLSRETIETLGTAAIIGREFDSELLATVAGDSRETIEERLRTAERFQLIQSSDVPAYRFRHDKIRECLYLEVQPFRRQRLHGFIGRALEMQGEPFSSRNLADLAYHYSRSGDRARGADFGRRAGEQAMEAYAADEAMAHFNTALALTNSDDECRGPLLFRLGEAASLAGNEEQAVSAFTSAQNWYEQTDDRVRAGRAALFSGRSWWRQEMISQARMAFERAHALLKDSERPELVEVLVDLASLLAVSQHELEAGIALAYEALRLAELLNDEHVLAASNRSLGNLLVRANDIPAGIQFLGTALDLAITMDDLAEAAECCAALANAYYWQGSINRSRDVTMKRLEYAKRSHDPYQMRHIYPWLSALDGMQGRIEEAKDRLSQAEIEIRALASPEPHAYLQFCHAALAFFTGDYRSAQQQAHTAIDLFRQIGPDALVWYMGIVALIEAALGNEDETRRLVAEFEPLFETLPEGTMPTAEPLCCVIGAALALDDRERLDRYYPKLLKFEGQFHDLLVDRLLGQIETLRGALDQAEEHLNAAEIMARREGIVWEIPRILMSQARLALARDGRNGTAKALQYLEQVRATGGLTINLVEYQRLQAQIDDIRGSRPAPTIPN